MYDRDDVASAVVRSVLLQLRLGKESFFPLALKEYGDMLVISPLANKDVQFDVATVMIVGPQSLDEGTVYVNIRLNGTDILVEASCEVDGDGYAVSNIESAVYVNGIKLTKRSTRIRAGRLMMWEASSGFDFESVSATIIMPNIVLV